MARNLPRVFPKVKHVPPVVRTRSTASHSSVRTLSTASLTFPGPKSGTLWKASLPSCITFPRRPPPQHPDHQRHHRQFFGVNPVHLAVQDVVFLLFLPILVFVFLFFLARERTFAFLSRNRMQIGRA